jgi:hypothetical protein
MIFSCLSKNCFDVNEIQIAFSSANKNVFLFPSFHFIYFCLDIATATPIIIPRIAKMMKAMINFILIFFHHIFFFNSLAFLLKTPACCCNSSAAFSMVSSFTQFCKAMSTFSCMTIFTLSTFFCTAANLSTSARLSNFWHLFMSKLAETLSRARSLAVRALSPYLAEN